MSKPIPVITIDGPSGTGKGTVSAILCEKLGFHFLDSGALYRLLGFAANKHQVDFGDIARLGQMAEKLDIEFQVSANKSVATKIFLEKQDVTDDIRTEVCGNLASKVAVIPQVRQALVARQLAFRQSPGLVADGRDMGTVIFPDAQLKIYLTATAEERAQRRYNQLRQKGIDVKLADLFEEIKERDERDSQRKVAPLKPAEDAVVIDTSILSIDAVVDQVMALWAGVSS